MNLESQDQRILLLRDGDKDEYGWEIRKGTSGDKVSNSSKKRHIGRRHQLQHTAAKKEKKKNRNKTSKPFLAIPDNPIY